MDQWGQREEALFNATLKRAVGERLAYLEQACAGDFALRRRVEARLQAHQQSYQETESPSISGGVAQPEVTPTLGLSLTEQVGDRIGHYKLLQKIGEGGFGVVYMAEQEEPVRRRVALKIIKLGMDTKEVIARFEAERQALAMMDHANIAKVLDAGATETGRPYFVMELVRGIKITDYCDQNALSTGQRLELFIAVCGAVQHAHQKGIIHRDIKPSNILVTASEALPVPKVIDFGIAKATQGRLTDQTIVTAFEQFIGTPAYMSPEQAMMTSLDIDTRSDIYSLGVLLYELLTGKTPFDKAELLAVGLEGMRRLIRDKEPQRPSTKLSSLAAEEQTTTAKRRQTDPPRLIRLLRGDLDWIVMKCLEKDRTRRYETANGLAMDLERHLQNEPVVACPPSRLYLFQKLVQRNKLAFGAAGAVTAALVIGLGLSTGLFFKEREARRVAVAAQDSAERARASEALQRQQAQADQAKARTEAAKSQQVSKFLKDMLQGVGPSVALGRDTKMLREILDETAKRVGKELTNQPEVEVELRLTLAGTYDELGLYEQMEAMARQGLQLARTKLGPENASVAKSLNSLANASMRLGDLQAAEKYGQEGLAMRRELFGEEHEQVAESLSDLCLVLQSESKLDEAETAERQALAMRQKLLGNEHVLVAQSLNNLAGVLYQKGKLAEAESKFREALVIQRKLLGNEHPYVGQSLNNLALVLQEEGKLAEAETMQRETLVITRKLYGEAHPHLATDLNNLALALHKEGKVAEAETTYREALEMRRKLFGNEHLDVANSLNNVASLLQTKGKLAEAEAMQREALAMRLKLLGNEHLDVAQSFNNVAHALLAQGKLAEAETMVRQALAIRQNLLGNEHLLVAASLNNLATVLHDQHKLAEAEPIQREALAMQRKLLGDEHPDLAQGLNNLARLLLNQGKVSEAEAMYRQALAMKTKLLGNQHPDTAKTLIGLAVSLKYQGKLAEAETELREVVARLRTPSVTNRTDAPDLPVALCQLADVLRERKALAEARSLAEEAVAMYQRHSDWYPRQREMAFRVCGLVLVELKDLGGAEALYRDELDGLRARLPGDDSQVTGTLALLTSTLLAEGKFAEAEPLARENLRLRDKSPDHWQTFEARTVLGSSLSGQQKYAEAEPLLLAGCEGIERQKEQTFPERKLRLQSLRQAVERLVRLYEATDRPKQATEWRKKLAEPD